MISFTKTDLEAIAMLRPVTANTNKIDIDEFIIKAHYERSVYVRALFVNGFKKVTAVYRARRQNASAIRQLKTMSNRELSDMGVARCDIERAVLGEIAFHPSILKRSFDAITRLVGKYRNWQDNRTGYAQLIAMDARQLSDIGLTRGD
ncbi:MAG: DUF1127 domain-containing protein, partial [Sneathiella sp.]|nr:DUF1127 domain-containing protein [Sneathiella sp.]